MFNLLNIFKKKEQIIEIEYKQPLIDVSKLNPIYSYCGIEVGTSCIAKIIQHLEHKIYKNVDKNLLGSHTFILRYVDGKWKIVENHKALNGVKEYDLVEYLDKNKNSEKKFVELFEHSFNSFAINYYSSKYGNPGYSLVDLFNISEERLIGITTPDDSSLICSSFCAMCDSYFSITTFFKKPAHQIAPADLQHYFKQNNIKNINI
jgi:hypothetical protein